MDDNECAVQGSGFTDPCGWCPPCLKREVELLRTERDDYLLDKLPTASLLLGMAERERDKALAHVHDLQAFTSRDALEFEETTKRIRQETYQECIQGAEALLRHVASCGYNESYGAGIERVIGRLKAYAANNGPITTPLDGEL